MTSSTRRVRSADEPSWHRQRHDQFVFYGDKNNWYACYTFWLFKYYGHDDCRIMDGGRTKWEGEGRAYTREIPSYPPTTYTAKDPDPSIRAFRDDVLAMAAAAPALVDVRSPQEYTGEVIHMMGYPQEGRARRPRQGRAQHPLGQGGESGRHLQDAGRAARPLYEGEGITPDKSVIAYCRIGERSSHTWFVLKYLLGYPDVRNYDGSWTEYGSMVNVPIEKGP